jgi:hypothetical protein
MRPNAKIAILIILATLVPIAIIAFCIIWIQTRKISAAADDDNANDPPTATAAPPAATPATGAVSAPAGAGASNTGNP